MKYAVWSLFCFSLLVAAGHAFAVDKPKPFDGTWILDSRSSEPLDAILKGMGYGWLSRKIMGTLAVRQVIQTRTSGLAVRVLTRFSDDTIVLPTDNRWAIGRTLDGEQTQRRSRWVKNRSVLVTEDRYEQGLLVTVRRRVNSTTFHEEVSFKAPGQPVHQAIRVFRLQVD